MDDPGLRHCVAYGLVVRARRLPLRLRSATIQRSPFAQDHGFGPFVVVG